MSLNILNKARDRPNFSLKNGIILAALPCAICLIGVSLTVFIL